jgi:hypothetical protein
MKDHVSGKARRVKAVLKNKFGWDINDLDHALTGDVEALKRLGTANNKAIIASDLLPQVKEAFLNIYGTTEEYNRAIADILKQGGNSAIAIANAEKSATLDNTKYAHKRTEMATDFVIQKKLEYQRFRHAIDYMKMKAIIDSKMNTVDNRATLEAQINRPALKQMTTDLNHEAQVRSHVLEFGEHERRELIPARDYNTATSGFLGRVRSALGLGV